MDAGPLIVTYPLTGCSRAIVEEELGGTSEAIYLADLAPADRANMLRRAGAALSHDTSKELQPDEIPLIRNARLLQFTAAGVDWVPTRDLPRELPIAANKGGGRRTDVGAHPRAGAGRGEAPVHRARQPRARRIQPAQRQPDAARRCLRHPRFR